MSDLIERQAVIDWLKYKWNCNADSLFYGIQELPSAQPETCEGCRHLGKWENEVEYGYPSPCICCKRRVEDHYER